MYAHMLVIKKTFLTKNIIKNFNAIFNTVYLPQENQYLD